MNPPSSACSLRLSFTFVSILLLLLSLEGRHPLAQHANSPRSRVCCCSCVMIAANYIFHRSQMLSHPPWALLGACPAARSHWQGCCPWQTEADDHKQSWLETTALLEERAGILQTHRGSCWTPQEQGIFLNALLPTDVLVFTIQRTGMQHPAALRSRGAGVERGSYTWVCCPGVPYLRAAPRCSTTCSLSLFNYHAQKGKT